MQNNVLETLMTRDGDREQFKKLYPFTPAFMEVLVGAASVLQRQRTGLRLLAQILDQDAGRMQLGEIFPVGDLFRIMEQGSDAFSKICASSLNTPAHYALDWRRRLLASRRFRSA